MDDSVGDSVTGCRRVVAGVEHDVPLGEFAGYTVCVAKQQSARDDARVAGVLGSIMVVAVDRGED
ncbi:hypothetical protein ACH46_04450 [Gordonia phthalatica]|uniref:Uncharacterized protein n=1 Tax=Gordonia phthalatica TaxID=1136941 RepID=A0A0N9NEA3_9ACTN|nr:hypothetical protein ACH46_04450 [Gordonia phthalatica]